MGSFSNCDSFCHGYLNNHQSYIENVHISIVIVGGKKPKMIAFAMDISIITKVIKLAVSLRRVGDGSKTEQNGRYGFASFSGLNV